jgi:DNA polymerase III alpha subunit
LAVEKDIDMDKYARRLDTELEVINMKGYPAYFLILDPVKYGLLFERFLNPERTAMPDKLVA